MTRSEFIRICGILGVTAPFQSSLTACKQDPEPIGNFSGKVIIIGAGAGGLAAGHLLDQQGIQFEILEASTRYGGRMKIDTEFADFPIPLGAEWIETGTEIFKEIVNDSSVAIDVPTVDDDPDKKFINSSWYNFYEQYILPSISNKIKFNEIVESIDYSGEQVMIRTQNAQLSADKVIISVPLKVLQDRDISFLPDLPQQKLDAIDNSTIWEGFKAFFEFSEQFYGDGYEFLINPETDGQKIYYNASHGQNTTKNILGLFTVGKPALDFVALSDDQIKSIVLSELDNLFANQASSKYIKHISQNWNDEPFIKAGYISDHSDWRSVKELGKSVANKLYFAGGAYTDGEDWVSVHTAAQSAKAAVDEVLK